MESSDIITKIVNIMICNVCKKHFSHPIRRLEDGTICCRRCFEKYEDEPIFTECLYLNKIGELLDFPCFYKEYGCRELCSWKESTLHECECPFRQYGCPSLECLWKGAPRDLRLHYTNKHQQLLSHDLPLDFDNNTKINYLIEDLGELFVFQLECNLDEDMLWCDVRFIGSPQRAPRYHFKIDLFGDDDKDHHYVDRKQVEADEFWILEKTEAISIRITMLKAMLHNSDTINLKVKIANRKPLYNGQADLALMHEVECPVCKDHMVRPIRMCLSGHSICNNCYQKLRECPTCRGKFCEIRNISLETLSEQMHYRCMHFDEGCTFTDVPSKIKDHEMSCDISYYDCPLKQFFNCKWRGKVGDVCIHACKEHQFKF